MTTTDRDRIISETPKGEPIRLIGRCSACRCGVLLEGQPIERVTESKGVGLAAGKLFTDAAIYLAGVKLFETQGARAAYAHHTCRALGVDQSIRVEEVQAKETKHQCGAKCRNATGPACECSCKGKNHGGGWC